MERAAKIRKTANVADCGKSPFEGSKPPPPIVYTVPGFILDVRLNVFGQEYHCHSVSKRSNRCPYDVSVLTNLQGRSQAPFQFLSQVP